MLLLAFCVPAALQFGQFDLAWEEPPDSSLSNVTHPIEVEAMPDGGFLVLSLERELPLGEFDRPATIGIARFSENGDPVWNATIDSPPVPSPYFTGQRLADSVVSDEGEVFVVASRPGTSVLRRYGANGALVWEVDLPQRTPAGAGAWTLYNAAFVDLAPNGDVIVGGIANENTYPRADVRAVGLDGAPRWEWRGEPAAFLGTTAHMLPRGMTVGPDGTIYLFGQSDQPAYQHGTHVIALNSDGTFRWRDARFDPPFPFVAADFDSQGRLVLAGGFTGGVAQQSNVVKYAADGTRIFSTLIDVSTSLYTVHDLAVDALDRISVAGAAADTVPGPAAPALLRFDAGGAFLGHSISTAAAPGEDGSFTRVLVTPRNDVVAAGVSGDGPDGIVLARFGPDGAERWSERRRGVRPLPSRSSSVGTGLGMDARGNVVVMAQFTDGGLFPGQWLGLDLAKYVPNGPAGTPYCGPAVANSTGLPASLRGLGPSLRSANNVTLRADDLPSGALTLFLASRTQGSVINVGGGQGTLCLDGSIGRFLGPGQVRVAGLNGSASLQLDLDRLPQPTGSVSGSIGETWSFQAWFRDANPGPTSNLTDGVAIPLQ